MHPDDAATKIHRALRAADFVLRLSTKVAHRSGTVSFRMYLAKKKTAALRASELIFLGMESKPGNPETDPDQIYETIRSQRKVKQEQAKLELQRMQVVEEEKLSFLLCVMCLYACVWEQCLTVARRCRPTESARSSVSVMCTSNVSTLSRP